MVLRKANVVGAWEEEGLGYVSRMQQLDGCLFVTIK